MSSSSNILYQNSGVTVKGCYTISDCTPTMTITKICIPSVDTIHTNITIVGVAASTLAGIWGDSPSYGCGCGAPV